MALIFARRGTGKVLMHGSPVDQRSHGLRVGPHCHEHAAHVRVVDDQRHRLRSAHRTPLPALSGVGDRVLVGALRHGHTLDAHRYAGDVHHREHVPHALIGASQEVPDRSAPVLAVDHDTCRGGLDTEFVLQRHHFEIVALARLAACVRQELRHDEHRDPLRAGRGAVDAGEHQMDHVARHVVVAVGDEDLGAGEAVGSVPGRMGPGVEGAHVRSGVGLGEVHRGRPLARDQPGKVQVSLLIGSVGGDGGDGAVGQQRAGTEGEASRGEELFDGHPEDAGHVCAAPPSRCADRSPSGVDVGLVCLLETGRGDHVAVLQGRSLHVPDPVERRHQILDEASALLQQ